MKKKIIGAALIAAMAVAAGWNFNQSKNETQLSDLTMANVDALARGEAAVVNCETWHEVECVVIIKNSFGEILGETKVKGKNK